MPVVRKLSSEEAQNLEHKRLGPIVLVREEYDRYMAEFTAGDVGEAALAAGENRLTVRTRLRAAARRRGLALDFKRTRDNVLRFKVVTGDVQVDAQTDAPQAEERQPEPVPVSSDVPPTTTKRKGRPRKQEG